MFTKFRTGILPCYICYLTDYGARNSYAILPLTCKKFSIIKANLAKVHATKPDDNEIVSETSEYESETFGLLKKDLETSKSFRAVKRNRQYKKSSLFKTKKSDTFGTLSDNKIMWYPEINEESKVDNDPSDDSVIVRNLSKKYKCPQTYFKEMERLVQEKRLKEALDLFPDMRRNYVTPIHGHYTSMISACGKAGYTDMAFQLFRQMTDRGYRPTPATLTGLFNSCAESPFPKESLKRALGLKEKIESKNWQLTQITYHSMIKAFGKCGDIKMAFQIVDEMARAEIKIDVVTYSFLLMSCISNKEAGFTHAVEVWRKMKAKRCLPNLFTCNLLLRAVRDCDAGPEEVSNLLLQHWSSYSKRPYGFETKKSIESKKKILLLPNAQQSDVIDNSVNIENTQKVVMTENTVNISSAKFHVAPACSNSETESLVKSDQQKNDLNIFQSSSTSLLDSRPLEGPEILELVNISGRNERLALIGGMEGFLNFMVKAGVKPNIKTFTLFLENVPSNTECEEKLLSLLDAHKVEPDIDFFNILIKKRNFRTDGKAAHNVLLLISKYSLLPDIVTFGVLALGCRSYSQAVDFINDMEKFGFSPNIEILDSLLKNAGRSMDFTYLRAVLNLMKKLEIRPDEHFLKNMEKLLTTTRKNIIDMEQGEKVANIYYQADFGKKFKMFCSIYEEWLKSINFDAEQHPWAQYATNIIARTKDEVTHYPYGS